MSKKDYKKITVAFSPSAYDDIRLYAEDRGVSLSEFIRGCYRMYDKAMQDKHKREAKKSGKQYAKPAIQKLTTSEGEVEIKVWKLADEKEGGE